MRELWANRPALSSRRIIKQNDDAVKVGVSDSKEDVEEVKIGDVEVLSLSLVLSLLTIFSASK